MTTSLASTAPGVRTLGVAAVMSMPTSAMAATATGLTRSAGMVPAERISTASLASAVRKPAAIWERPALCTQTNRTLGLSDTVRSTLAGISKRSGRFTVSRRRGSGVLGQLGEQCLHVGVDVVADGSNLGERSVFRISHRPVEVAL